VTPRAGRQHSPDPAPAPRPRSAGKILLEQSTPSPSACQQPHKGTRHCNGRLRRWETDCSSHIQANSPTEGCHGRFQTAPTTPDWQWLQICCRRCGRRRASSQNAGGTFASSSRNKLGVIVENCRLSLLFRAPVGRGVKESRTKHSEAIASHVVLARLDHS